MDRSLRRTIAFGGVVVILGAVGANIGVTAAASSTQVVARRIVVNSTAWPGVNVLVIPGLGYLKGYCQGGSGWAWISWSNDTGGPVDRWSDYSGETQGIIQAHGQLYQNVASWNSSTRIQEGGNLELGRGNSPGPRRTATVRVNIYRGGVDAPCGFQAMATVWSTP